MQSRRDVFRFACQTLLAGYLPLGSLPLGSLTPLESSPEGPSSAVRCINIVNFMRGVEPRFQTDLLLPVQKQMELILAARLPATWLLQFDALVAGPFVEYLKAHMAPDHEVGFWFEMNRMLCEAAGVAWRGRPGYEWDHLPPVAFTIGYSPKERIQLADAAMGHFKSIWGRYPRSVASWNLDSITIAHLVERYGVEAFAVCRDQIATDGFTIWGAPIAGYYPSKVNCWSPALDASNQIHAPVFRMLGQDPVYYYQNGFKLPDGRAVNGPDTMEPTWITGQSPEFVNHFLGMIADSPCMSFAYAQLGQENSFPWEGTAQAYPLQMKALASLRDRGSVHVETMGESGGRFKKAFATTPVQAQVMLGDPFGNTNPAETTVWYQSRFYRANLHFRGGLPFLRDITVYRDGFAQPFLTSPTRENDVEQRIPAVLDGYHWRPDDAPAPGAGGFFELDGERLETSGSPRIEQQGSELWVEIPLQQGWVLVVRFGEREIKIHMPKRAGRLELAFEWDPAKSALAGVSDRRVRFRQSGFDYSIGVLPGSAKATPKGWTAAAVADGDLVSLRLRLST